MKLLFYTISIALGAMLFTSCGASKTLAQTSPVETFVMPCSEFKTGDGILRAWASGVSDNQMAARKKAQNAAVAQLAAMLNQVVESTTTDLSTNLTDSNTGLSKSLMNEAVTIVVKQTLQGATVACDKWAKDDATGQYTNYVVMELRGEAYLEALYSVLEKSGNTSYDRKQLEELFLKHLNATAAK